MSKVLTYRIELLQPVLVAALDGDPNSAVAFDYFPGSVLRGALLHRYCQQQNINQDGLLTGASANDIKPLFFDGSTRFLNAYVAVANSAVQNQPHQRALPAPLSWHQKKEERRKAGKTTKTHDLAFMNAPTRNDANAQ